MYCIVVPPDDDDDCGAHYTMTPTVEVEVEVETHTHTHSLRHMCVYIRIHSRLCFTPTAGNNSEFVIAPPSR